MSNPGELQRAASGSLVLRVTTIHASSAAASARYYTQYLAGDDLDGEGRWAGRRTAALGLAGRVATEDLEAILSGHDPAAGAQLGYPLGDRYDTHGRVIAAVAGFDATFSAPKSLSVWWALSGDDGLLEAHNAAVAAALEHLERFGATTRIRVNGGRQHPDVDGLVMAVFPQATSREDDPQLHTHVVVSAKVLAPDGRWLALDARYLKRKQRMLGGLYQSVLRSELTARYGVAWGEIINGQAEIAGVPTQLLEVFSKRTVQVDAALADKIAEFGAREGRDPTRWERAALTREAAQDAREAKTHVSPGDLGARWALEADMIGWGPERLAAAVRDAALIAPERRLPGDAEIVEQLSAGGSAWTRADVLKAICDLAPPVAGVDGRRWATAVEDACDRIVAKCVSLDPPTVATPCRASDGRSMWIPPHENHLTTEAVLAQEERILTHVIEAHDTPPAPSLTVDTTGLDPLQADAAAAAAGKDPLVLVVGPAGAGKTATLRSAAQDLHTQQRPVFAVAPTAKAAKVLRDEIGVGADTVAKLLFEWRNGPPDDGYRLPAGTTLVVDEAGMAGTGSLDLLVTLAATQGWRLVLVGDPDQLQAVGRGGMFAELCRSGRVHELATIHRFTHTWERAASLGLRAGDPEALDTYADHGRIAAGSFDAVAARVAAEWVQHNNAGRTVAVVAETNEHVDALNHAIQHERRTRHEVGPSAARISAGEAVGVGDVICTRRNDRTLRTDRGEPVRNRDRWTVTAVAGDGSLAARHDNGHGNIALPADYASDHVRLGYAATAHGHQGDTVDVSYTVVTAATTHRSLYVGATRGRHDNRLLVVSDDPQAAHDILAQVLTNDRADLPAVAQRRHLEQHEPRPDASAPENDRGAVEREAAEAAALAEPHLVRVRDAQEAVRRAEADLYRYRRELTNTAAWQRRAARRSITSAALHVTEERQRLAQAEATAAPWTAQAAQTASRLLTIDNDTETARSIDLDNPPTRRAPGRTLEPDVGLEL